MKFEKNIEYKITVDLYRKISSSGFIISTSLLLSFVKSNKDKLMKIEDIKFISDYSSIVINKMDIEDNTLYCYTRSHKVNVSIDDIILDLNESNDINKEDAIYIINKLNKVGTVFLPKNIKSKILNKLLRLKDVKIKDNFILNTVDVIDKDLYEYLDDPVMYEYKTDISLINFKCDGEKFYYTIFVKKF